jgi:hypothetical protein
MRERNSRFNLALSFFTAVLLSVGVSLVAVAQQVTVPTNIANGEWCGKPRENDKNCESGACYPSPGLGNWGICVATNRNCAWPGEDDGMFKDQRKWRGQTVECMDPDPPRSRARYALK